MTEVVMIVFLNNKKIEKKYISVCHKKLKI
jgi:hypothetical protein